jgi:anti-sigma-K factor RskA
VQILTTPGARSSDLDGTKDAPNAHAVLALDRQSGRAVLAARGLPPAPAGKAYQLWFISNGRPPAPGKVFTTDAAGNALLEDHLPPTAADASVFAVTLEPHAGVPAPTGSMYLLSPANGRL